jgi:tRNA dimethylallyltransferase
VVGGTGLYLRAALTRLELKPPPPAGLREELERELALLGSRTLHGRLGKATGGAVHPNDGKRIIRALELERMGEAPYERSDELWSDTLRRPTALFGLVIDRDRLATRIEARVEQMIAGGAVQEVERALERGASRTARKAIGFAELAAYLQGDASLEEAKARIERRQRQYAKRQVTWMRKLANVRIIDRTGRSAREVAEEIDGALARGALS